MGIEWAAQLARRLRRRGEAVAPAPVNRLECYVDALLALGFDVETYRQIHPVLGGLSRREAAAHYHLSGRVERFPVAFGPSLPDAQARIGGLDLPEDDKHLLRLDVAAAELRRADAAGRDADRTSDLLRRTSAHRPLVVVGDSHGALYLSEDVLRGGRLLPVPFLCTGASARGLGNPHSRMGAGQRIRVWLDDRRNELEGVPVLCKFGQVDLEFVYDYRRVRDNRRPFDLAHAAAFAEESAGRYVDFLAGLRDATGARLVVTAALPPALNDAALREGYMNAHIVEVHAGIGPDALREALKTLEMPSWLVRTDLARRYNAALAAACEGAGLTFFDDFTPLLGPEGVIDPALIVWHGGTDHHLCFTSPAARRAVAGFAAEIAAL